MSGALGFVLSSANTWAAWRKRMYTSFSLLKANERCEIPHRSFAFNSENEVYILFLHAAHVFADDKTNPNAPLIALCPKCHWSYDHPKTPDDWAFIGLVYQWV